MMELSTLLARCREGNELAWEALVRQYQGRVYGLTLHYAGEAEEARDLAQEVFVRIFRNLDRCPDAERFVPWMLRVARNACIDHLRRRKARPPARDVPVLESPDLVSPAPGPQDEWQAGARKRLLQRALAALGRFNREIILLKEIHGLSLEEIADILDIPLGTVKSRAHRARLALAREVLSLSAGGCGRSEPG